MNRNPPCGRPVGAREGAWARARDAIVKGVNRSPRRVGMFLNRAGAVALIVLSLVAVVSSSPATAQTHAHTPAGVVG